MESKSRREKRKEARLAHNKQKHDSWLQNQKSQRMERQLRDVKSKKGNKIKNSQTRFLKENEIVQQASEHSTIPSKAESKLKLEEDHDFNESKMVKGKKSLKRTSKTKFEEYLEMETPNAAMLAQKDLELERKLAKKLKVKDGKLRGDDDDLNMLFEDVPSALESWDEEVPDTERFSDERTVNPTSSKKHKKKKSADQAFEDDIADDSTIAASELEDNAEMAFEDILAKAPARKRRRKRKFLQQGQEGNMAGETALGVSLPTESHSKEVALNEASPKAPAMEGNVKYVAPRLRSHARNESEEQTQIRRRVRGLLNRLSESNVESITGEMAAIFRSISRSVSSQIISEEVLASCYNGPRGNEQHAAVFASFVAGMACLVGMDFSAKLIASLAKTFEEEYLKEDNLSLRNLTLLLSYLCIFGVCSSDLIYDFLIMLSKRLTEIDVSTILTILQCCGMKIRGDDPATMKNFILSVQNRVSELKASSGDGQGKINGRRMEFMLETICDIKNNKKRPKEDTVQHTRIKKWLQKLKVEDILIRGLKWSKLLDPEKKGQWWLSGDMVSATNDVEEVASRIDKEALEAQKMLELAAAQRMNTDGRRAIFCIIMSGEDYIDAFEKLLRLDLPGKQDRDIMRVLVECCLQEKVFNKYYTVLAAKLCEHDKNHKFTLQFCLWDHFKELDSMPLIRSMHLAKFIAEMVASFTLSLAVLKTVEWSDPQMLSSKRVMHFRMLFEAIFEYPDKLIWNMFTRIAVTPELEPLRQGMEFFIKEYVVKTNKKVNNKFKVAKKALNNTEGVLM
ncbi:MIF4G domain and MA3 domain-containing protein isoform 1 [Theobroma cacao]|uniref:MIF4G domain and MA3 domain-containing protein isoform 1 n=1 Tax=Theobroma cacao TaxID=3641 RepID=A0A061F7P1_THECC|nr:MIF4G domain and MA3 domain-containing protein isoform 1 [Theobroma cacao]EOY10531.1 MIF4G domain and MA3 domain-containing protein isoform 1 [Theobroma cacao]